MAEKIEISYSANPPGQVGTKPRKVKKNSQFRITTQDAGVLTGEFLNDTPLEGGAKKFNGNQDLKVIKIGRFPFKCILKVNGQTIILGDPNDPNSLIGGELEVIPE